MAGQIYTVSTSAELLALLQSHPEGGIEIRLEPGEYDLTLSKWQGADYGFDSNVIITSADPDNPAVFTTMKIANAANLTFDNLVFDMTAPTGPIATSYNVFSISDSSNITVTNSLFDGDVASGASADLNGYGIGIGLRVLNSEGVTIADNEVRNFFAGITVRESSDVTISGNDIHSIANDGIKIAAVQGLLIEDNYLHDPNISPLSDYHNDMIQFFTLDTTAPTTDVIIRGNTIDIGAEGTWTQSIFLHNEAVDAGAGTEMYYQNILIEDNVIYNSHLNGIYVDYGDGVTISNNTLVQVLDQNANAAANPVVWVPGIVVGSSSTDVTITDNVTGSIATTSGKGAWVIDGNIIAQNTDPNAPNFYENIFVTSSMEADENGNNAWIVAPGSVVETAGAGSSLQLLDDAPEGIEAAFDITSGDTSSHTLVFDATTTMGSSGALDEDAVYTWDFGDGTTATGALVQHSYADTDSYQVTLTVTTAEGLTDTATATAKTTSDTIAVWDSATGAFTTDHYGETVLLADRAGDSVLDLGAKGAVATIARDDLLAFFGADEFSMSLTLQSGEAADDYGEIARLHNTFILSVDKTGALVFSLTTNDGTLKLTSAGLNMLDGAEHDITLNYDSAAGLLEIVADGEVVASGDLTGTLPARASWGLSFGNPWGSQNFDGTLSGFSLEVPGQSWYEDYSGDLAGVSDGSEPSKGETGEEAVDEPTEATAGGGDGGTDTDAGTDTDTGAGGAVTDDTPLVDLAAILAGTGATAITLDGSGVKASLSRTALTSLYGASGFDLSFSIRSDGSAGNAGNVVMLYKMFDLSVDAKGNLVAQVTTADGSQTIRTTGIDMNDGAAHEVGLSYDSDSGLVQLTVDGDVAGTATATGDLIDYGYWNLNFGNPWIGDNFTSTITEFSLDTPDTATTDIAVGDMPVLDDYVLDIAAHTGSDSILLSEDISSQSLGKIAEFADSDRIGISMDFTLADSDSSSGVLLTSGGNLTVLVEDDGITVKVATGSGTVAFHSYDLGLQSGDGNTLVVLLDTETDQLQVIVNDALVIDETGTDLVFSRGLGQIWYVGSPWADSVEGQISDLRLDDDFSFVEMQKHEDLVNV